MVMYITEGDRGVTLSLKGRFDFHSHQQFRGLVEKLIAAGKPFLTIDLAGVDFIDSSALGMLLLARESCKNAGGGIDLVHPQEYVHRVLKLCRFDEVFQVER